MAEGNGNAVALSPQQRPIEVELFELDQRKAKMLAISPLFPEHLRKGSPEQNVANCYLVLTMAREMKEDPLILAQNIYIVHGKAGWASTYLIAKANASGKFQDPIDWEVKGSGDAMEVTAYAVVKSTGKRVAAAVSMKMAKAEGWSTKPGSKYATMPEQMLKYRSATFLVRLYCPEVMLGMPPADEVEDRAPAPSVAHVNRVSSLESKLMPPEEPTTFVDADGEIHEQPELVGATNAEDPADWTAPMPGQGNGRGKK